MNRASAAVRPQSALPAVAIVTTDEQVAPEATQYLSADFQLQMLQTWEGLLTSLQQQSLDAILLDLDTLGENSDAGVAGLRELRNLCPDLVLIAMTRSNSRNLRWKAMEATADEYFVAPVDFQEVQIVLARALEKRLAELEYRSRKDKEVPQPSFCGLIGLSEPMQLVYEAVRRVAGSTSTVLIRGESGTGKELVARAIVAMSPRADKSFVSLNCAALPDNLIEAELFGHEKGAFTDARTSRAGHIEMADGGTLFLDEIATLGLPLQSKLLRVLEDRAVQRIGGKSPKKIDFRLITATNEDLEQMVHTGRFREDLYYRIHVVPLVLPALRERQGDIPLLVDHFLRRYCAANNTPVKHVDPEVMEVLEDYSWPGNVRELENLVQRLVLMAEGPVIAIKHLPHPILSSSTTQQESLLIPEEGISFDQEIAKIEIAYLQAALRRAQGKKIAAAALLRIDQQRMKYLCRKYRIPKR